MTKEQLIKLGLDEALAEKVAAASSEELQGFIPKARFDEVNNSKKELEGQVKERDKQLDTLKKSTGDIEAMKTEIAQLQETNKTAKADYEAKVKQMQVDNAVNSALTGAKAKNLKAVRALLNLENAELDGESVKGLADQIKKLQEDEGTKFLFGSDKAKFTGFVPGAGNNNTNTNTDTSVDFAKSLAASKATTESTAKAENYYFGGGTK
ncbi:MAG: phage scaffolding protein [Sporomusa sp.]